MNHAKDELGQEDTFLFMGYCPVDGGKFGYMVESNMGVQARKDRYSHLCVVHP